MSEFLQRLIIFEPQKNRFPKNFKAKNEKNCWYFIWREINRA